MGERGKNVRYDADDILQEILIKTHKNLDQLQSDQSVSAWLYQIANHTIIDYYRKQGRQRELTADDLWYTDDDSNGNSLSGCMKPFLQALPEQSRVLLEAVDINGQSQKTYANKMNLPYSTLKSQVKKAREDLRELFERCCHIQIDRRGQVMACCDDDEPCA